MMAIFLTIGGVFLISMSWGIINRINKREIEDGQIELWILLSIIWPILSIFITYLIKKDREVFGLIVQLPVITFLFVAPISMGSAFVLNWVIKNVFPTKFEKERKRHLEKLWVPHVSCSNSRGQENHGCSECGMPVGWHSLTCGEVQNLL